MPILAGQAKLKAAIKTRVYNALKKANAANGKSNPEADKTWMTQAEAISEIAQDICQFLLSDVSVAPNIPVVVVGSPSTQSGSTTSPGKLL
jgi:hypothetical protein